VAGAATGKRQVSIYATIRQEIYSICVLRKVTPRNSDLENEMTNNLTAWAWLLAVFPLWIVMALLWFSLASVPKKAAGPRMCKLIDGMAVGLSMCCAIGVLVGLDCGSLISLPFADQACHASTLQLAAWVKL
jgi:hypothetical protein